MENKEFRILRKKLEKTQKQMSELLRASLGAV
jgi:DNA-binding XRE family transcriptional regulator